MSIISPIKIILTSLSDFDNNNITKKMFLSESREYIIPDGVKKLAKAEIDNDITGFKAKAEYKVWKSASDFIDEYRWRS